MLLNDIIAPGLKVLFVGYNPSIKSEEKGHHFAGPGNLFWTLLADSGLTDHRLNPDQDGLLIYWGLGITNLVARATPGAADLSRQELQEGTLALRNKISFFRPEVVAFLGKDIYRVYLELAMGRPLTWGLQKRLKPDDVPFQVVVPNPSRRSTIPYGMRLRYFIELKGFVEFETKSLF